MKPAFVLIDEGRMYEIYADGSVVRKPAPEHLGPNAIVVVNNIPALLDKARSGV